MARPVKLRGPQAWNKAVVDAHEAIRNGAGIRSGAEYVRQLRENGVEISSSTYARWKRGEVQDVAGWTLMAAAQIFNRSLDEVLNLEGGQLDQLNSKLQGLERQMRDLNEETSPAQRDALQGQITRMRQILIRLVRDMVDKSRRESAPEAGPVEVIEILNDLEYEASRAPHAEDEGREGKSQREV